MTKINNLTYDPVNPSIVNDILTKYKNHEIIHYISDLYNLIEYQRKVIADQNKTIVSLRHKVAWEQYDKPIEHYDPSVRKFVDKPPKSGNMSC